MRTENVKTVFNKLIFNIDLKNKFDFSAINKSDGPG